MPIILILLDLKSNLELAASLWGSFISRQKLNPDLQKLGMDRISN